MSTCSPLTPAQLDELSSWESSLTAHGKTPSRHTCCSCPPRVARHVLWITSSGSGHVLNKYGLKTKIRKQKPPSYVPSVILAAPPAPSIHQQSARRHGSCLNNMSADEEEDDEGWTRPTKPAGDQVSRSPQVRQIRAQRMERRFMMVSDSQEEEVRAASRHHGSWRMKLQLRKRRVDVFFSVIRGGPRLHEGMMSLSWRLLYRRLFMPII